MGGLWAITFDSWKGSVYFRISPKLNPMTITKMPELTMEGPIEWVSNLIELRLKQWAQASPFLEIGEDSLGATSSSRLSSLRATHDLSQEEQVILVLALLPVLKPQALDLFFEFVLPDGRMPTVFGGSKGANHPGFLPTGETALFLLAGNNQERRLQIMHALDREGTLLSGDLLILHPVQPFEPRWAGVLAPSAGLLEFVLNGIERSPAFNKEFPAEEIQTSMEWADLVLEQSILEQLDELQHWMDHGSIIMEELGMKRKLKPGYRSLFYGPPGTGKTLTAALLGKSSGRQVFKIDLSLVVSKYIGETEKNLSRIFAQAEGKGWILFFDEADALFGKRTKVSDAHDRFANQEVSYLLQRVEGYDGIVILASNQKANMDDAFIRRFQSIIHFPLPRFEERMLLWNHAFPEGITIGSDLDLQKIAEKYELSGGSIMNVVRTCLIRVVSRGDREVSYVDLEAGLRKEFQKEGKMFR